MIRNNEIFDENQITKVQYTSSSKKKKGPNKKGLLSKEDLIQIHRDKNPPPVFIEDVSDAKDVIIDQNTMTADKYRKNTGVAGKTADMSKDRFGEREGFFEDISGETSAKKLSDLIKSRGTKNVIDDWSNIEKKFRQELVTSNDKNARNLAKKIKNLSKGPGIINWKQLLSEILDKKKGRGEIELRKLPPNKRLWAQGRYAPGEKRVMPKKFEEFNDVVIIMDTSYSISRQQTEVFLKEVSRISLDFEYTALWIIYCSDDIDGVDRVEYGRPPDMSKYSTTGGNMKGFIPPFELIHNSQKGNFVYEKTPYIIKPSVIIYMTDTQAVYPSKELMRKLDIFPQESMIEEKVIWFCVPLDRGIDEPPFGRHFIISPNAIKTP
jgi:predicted metal-dependent peptidase